MQSEVTELGKPSSYEQVRNDPNRIQIRTTTATAAKKISTYTAHSSQAEKVRPLPSVEQRACG